MLLRWYAKHQRDLPWRRTSDPYAIWVSEIMLQQTQVATAKPYYERFLKKFPTAKELAEASLDDVLKLWEGLGYYARARNMHKAARLIVADCEGVLPSSAKELLKLPGIGKYTAGAITSIAFGLDEPVLDGNVVRVLSRLFRVRKNPKETTTQKKLWSLARQLVPEGEAGLLNQALMDLGATVCVPKQPRCSICPLHEVCEARRHDEQNELPFKGKRHPLPHYDLGVGIVWKGDRLLLAKRNLDGLLGGLWEFPGGNLRGDESLAACAVREIREKLNVKVQIKNHSATIKHGFTHFCITVHAFECAYVSGKPKTLGYANWKWVAFDELDHYALPKATRKIVAVLKKTVDDGRKT